MASGVSEQLERKLCLCPCCSFPLPVWLLVFNNLDVKIPQFMKISALLI
jgi:hypothetical protein